MRRSSRRPDRAFAVLVALTLVSVTVAILAPDIGGSAAAFAALVISWVKMRQVLDHFLGLRDSGGGWRSGFAAFLLALLGALLVVDAFG